MKELSITISILWVFSLSVLAQKHSDTLGFRELRDWNKIERPQLSNDGKFTCYELNPNHGDGRLVLFDNIEGEQLLFPRSKKGNFGPDNNFVAFLTYPPKSTLDSLKRLKTSDEDFPKDTLKIFNLQTKELTVRPNVEDYSIPNWGDWIFYFAPSDTTQKDSISNKSNDGKIMISESIYNSEIDSFYNVVSYHLTEDSSYVFINESSNDSTPGTKIIRLDPGKERVDTILETELKITRLIPDQKGKNLAILSKSDSTSKNTLSLWQESSGGVKIIGNEKSSFLPANWTISEHFSMYFAQDSSRLFFGISPQPLVQDSSLLPEEVVPVEVWHYEDDYLYTRKEVELENDKKKSYLMAFDYEQDRIISIGSSDLPEILIANEGNGSYALGINNKPYRMLQSWEGLEYKDVYAVDMRTNKVFSVAKKISGNPKMSTTGQYCTWFELTDTSWHIYDFEKRKETNLTLGDKIFANELNDIPTHPGPYGIMGWTKDDAALLLYDRYDIWKISSTDWNHKIKLTSGRKDKNRFRYTATDPSLEYLPHSIYLHVFNEKEKSDAYCQLDMENGEMTKLLSSDNKLSRRIIKSKESSTLLFTEESFSTFPNLILSDTTFRKQQTISDANPQQKLFGWGSIEQVRWKSDQGREIEGLLVKPADFDPNRKYPMIVNFYERSSEGLHAHRAPEPHRSTINYSFYASNGYVIFNPDIHYTTGYPGASAEEAVISGTKYILSLGFVDSTRMALQGHSWGGYQIAHILTKTDMFRCAEAGAPVVNMTSAYGGIRWGSGRSRMFQYEHTQSRIGATLWENPELYLENSPLFHLEKMNTPVLILHNDQDGAVPWYQGIEYFVALRRLGKPAWLLNYNGEPHWPLKWHYRMDFNRRMFQFFEFYLKDAPMPKWMKTGVPPLEKGILQGFEYSEN